MIKISITGLDATVAALAGQQKQINYAASRALNNLAFKTNAKIKADMKATFKGGASPYALRAFQIDKASRNHLTAVIRLRDDAPAGGTAYRKALGHLFTGGTRQWKKVEGLLRGMGIIPSGLMAVPGAAARLDARGNMSRAELREMFGVLKSTLRNARVYRKTGGGKEAKGIGYFVVRPGSTGRTSRLQPGIWRRIETGRSSTIKPLVMFVKRGRWNKAIDLDTLGRDIVREHWRGEFNRELANAIRTAK